VTTAEKPTTASDPSTTAKPTPGQPVDPKDLGSSVTGLVSGLLDGLTKPLKSGAR
jgi:hypothetical protein